MDTTQPALSPLLSLQPPVNSQKDKSSLVTLVTPVVLGFFFLYPVLQSTCHPYEVTRALSSVSLASLFPTLVTDRTALCARSARLRSRNGELARRYLPAMCTGEQRERRASA